MIERIAAGEVIERPAQVVKELIENSIDAEATEIDVEVIDATEISVSDNGVGIPKDDLALAVERHATSKIISSEDLFRLRTYGFRGEALASLAAVSELSILSRFEKDECAYELKSHFGERLAIGSASHPAGTRIRFQRLFDNIPARKKFLKSSGAEIAQIRRTLKSFALCHPKVTFRLRNQGKLQDFYQKTSKPLLRVQEVLSTKPLYHLLGEENGFRAEIYFSSPHEVVKTSQNIWLFCQNRWITDRTLQSAILESYRNLLMHGEFPVVYLNLTVPDDFIDINVHPTKSQIRFLDNRVVFRFVHEKLREALHQAPWNSDRNVSADDASIDWPSRHAPQTPPEPNQWVNFEFTPASQQKDRSVLGNDSYQRVDFANENIQPMSSRLLFSSSAVSQQPQNGDTKSQFCEDLFSALGAPQGGFWEQMPILGQLRKTYIACKGASGLIMVDQHAAHERIMFERLQQSWKSGHASDVQRYLIPPRLTLNSEAVEALNTLAEQWMRMGIELEVCGPEEITVNAKPTWLTDKALMGALEKCAKELVELGGSFRMEKRLSDLQSTMACHSAVRAGDELNFEEMKSLLKQMDEFPLSGFCPHGRPVSVEWSWRDMEKDFGRIV